MITRMTNPESNPDVVATIPTNEELEQEQAKTKLLERELEAVKATAENLKKKSVNFFNNLLRKK